MAAETAEQVIEIEVGGDEPEADQSETPEVETVASNTTPTVAEQPTEQPTTLPESKPVDEPQNDIISDGVEKYEFSRLRLEHEIAEISMRLLETADISKSLKKRRDCLTEELSQLISDGPTPVRRETKPAAGETNQASSETNQAIPKGQQKPQPVNDSTEWRAVPLDKLELKKGVHSKLEDAGVETIGQLEDLRAAIANGKKEWPKGIGAAKITEIEDAIINWLTKNRDSAIFATCPAQPDIDPHAYPTSAQWEEWTDSQRAVYLADLAARFSDEVEAEGKPSAFHQAGYSACESGAELTDCPYQPGVEQDDWIRGFLKSDSDVRQEIESDSEEQTEPEPDESGQEVEPEPTSMQADNYGMAKPVGRNNPKLVTSLDDL